MRDLPASACWDAARLNIKIGATEIKSNGIPVMSYSVANLLRIFFTADKMNLYGRIYIYISIIECCTSVDLYLH